MTLPAVLPLDVVTGVVLYWLLIGVSGVLRASDGAFASRVLFPLSVGGAVVLTAAALVSMMYPPSTAVLPLGLPDLPFHLRLDSLSAFFVTLLGFVAIGISLFSAG